MKKIPTILLLTLLLALILAGCQPVKVSKSAMFNAPKESLNGWTMKNAHKAPLGGDEPKSGMWNDEPWGQPIRGHPFPERPFWLTEENA